MFYIAMMVSSKGLHLYTIEDRGGTATARGLYPCFMRQQPEYDNIDPDRSIGVFLWSAAIDIDIQGLKCGS